MRHAALLCTCTLCRSYAGESGRQLPRFRIVLHGPQPPALPPPVLGPASPAAMQPQYHVCLLQPGQLANRSKMRDITVHGMVHLAPLHACDRRDITEPTHLLSGAKAQTLAETWELTTV